MSHIKNLFFEELNRAMDGPPPFIRTPANERVAKVVHYGVELECHFEYEPEVRGAREPLTGMQLEPDYAATLTLVAAYVGAVDIMPLLSIDTIDDIEKELMP
jgi:hypothetical protein